MKISISDNGVGMSEKVKNKLLEGKSVKAGKAGHTTGIGISNVIHRLQLFFRIEDVMDIETEIDKGTKFTLKLPLKNKV